MAGRRRFFIEFSFIVALIVLIAGGHLVSSSGVSASPGTLFDLGRILNPLTKQGEIDPIDKCRTTLAALGASQLAYAQTNNWRYGNSRDLNNSLSYELQQAFWGSPYGYSIGWFVNRDKSDFLYTATAVGDVDLQDFMIDSRQMVMEIEPVKTGLDINHWLYLNEQQELSMRYNGTYWWFESGSSAYRIRSYLNFNQSAYCLVQDYEYAGNFEPLNYDYVELMYMSETSNFYIVFPSEVQVDMSVAYSNAENARGTLTAIASSNRAYRDSNPGDGTYGSFYDLLEMMYIAIGYTPDTMVSGYTLEWFMTEDKMLFSVVAIPTEYTEFNPVYMIDQTEVLRKLIPVATYTPDSNYSDMQHSADEMMNETGSYGWDVDAELTGYESDIDIYLLPEHDQVLLKIPVIHGVDDLVYVSSLGRFYSTEVVR